jgi:methyl-accepting chemotaxis protein
VTDAIGRIAETVQQIAAATAEQARGTELITKSADKMRLISQHVERSSQEQAKGSRQITSSIEHISQLVTQLAASQKTQGRSSEQLVVSAQKMEETLRAQEAAVVRLGEALDRSRKP